MKMDQRLANGQAEANGVWTKDKKTTGGEQSPLISAKQLTWWRGWLDVDRGGGGVCF